MLKILWFVWYFWWISEDVTDFAGTIWRDNSQQCSHPRDKNIRLTGCVAGGLGCFLLCKISPRSFSVSPLPKSNMAPRQTFHRKNCQLRRLHSSEINRFGPPLVVDRILNSLVACVVNVFWRVRNCQCIISYSYNEDVMSIWLINILVNYQTLWIYLTAQEESLRFGLCCSYSHGLFLERIYGSLLPSLWYLSQDGLAYRTSCVLGLLHRFGLSFSQSLRQRFYGLF